MIQLIEYNRMRFWQAVQEMLGEREKMTENEGKQVLTAIINNKDSVYQYLTAEDEKKLADAMPDKGASNIEEETETLKKLFLLFENVRENVDYGVISNLLKILAITAENQSILHENAYDRTQEKLFSLLFDCVFEEGPNA